MSEKSITMHEAQLLIQLGEMGNALWIARDRAWKLARQRNHWKRESLEQAKLLAMSADREEKLRTALRGLIVFTEEDQQFASTAYRKAFLRAREALQ